MKEIKTHEERKKFLRNYWLFFIIMWVFFYLAFTQISKNIDFFNTYGGPEFASWLRPMPLDQALMIFSLIQATIIVGIANGLRILAKYIYPQNSRYPDKYEKRAKYFSFLPVPFEALLLLIVGVTMVLPVLLFHTFIYIKEHISINRSER